MTIKCTFGFHSWKKCRCIECDKIRNSHHDWLQLSDKCSICGKEREIPIPESSTYNTTTLLTELMVKKKPDELNGREMSMQQCVALIEYWKLDHGTIPVTDASSRLVFYAVKNENEYRMYINRIPDDHFIVRRETSPSLLLQLEIRENQAVAGTEMSLAECKEIIKDWMKVHPTPPERINYRLDFYSNDGEDAYWMSISRIGPDKFDVTSDHTGYS